MRVTYFLFGFALLVAASRASAADNEPSKPAGEPLHIQAILVAASNTKAEPDKRLAGFEVNLRRTLRFDSFAFVGEGTADVPLPGSHSLPIAEGQTFELEAASYGGGQYWTRVRWINGDREFMNTILILRKGVPAVLGGIKRPAGGIYAVIIVAR